MAKQSDSSNKREKGNKDSSFEKVLHINRCSKVVKGGRKFSFSALILAGDGEGGVGYGFAKANELTDAIRKAGESARKNIKRYPKRGTSIPHEVQVDWDGSCVMLKPAPEGSGVIAGSQMRAILEMAGIKDVIAKSLGNSNSINIVKATFLALSKLCSMESIKEMRGIA